MLAVNIKRSNYVIDNMTDIVLISPSETLKILIRLQSAAFLACFLKHSCRMWQRSAISLIQLLSTTWIILLQSFPSWSHLMATILSTSQNNCRALTSNKRPSTLQNRGQNNHLRENKIFSGFVWNKIRTQTYRRGFCCLWWS